MSSAAAAGMRAFGLDRGLPFPLADLDTASTILMLGSNVADTMPPFVQHLAGRPRRRRPDRRRPPALRHRRAHLRRRRAAPAAAARHRPRPAPGHLPRGDPRGPRRRRHTSRSAPRATTPWSAASRLLARTRPVDHRRPRRADPRHRPAAGRRRRHAAAATSSPAAASNSTSTALTPPPPPSTSPSCWAAGLRAQRLRHAHRPGQRPGRPRARPEGRPAPRLPEDHRSRRPRPRGRVWGVDPKPCFPAPAFPPSNCSSRWDSPTASGASSCTAPTWRCPRRTRPP